MEFHIHHTDYVSISQAKLTYFASQILFLLLPPSCHWFFISANPATEAGTNAPSSLTYFPLLSLFLLEASHICPAYFPLTDTLCINQWQSNKFPHYSTHFFVVPLTFIILLENPLKYKSQINCMGFPFQWLLLMAKLKS